MPPKEDHREKGKEVGGEKDDILSVVRGGRTEYDGL